MHLTHPLRITTGQVVVDGDHMHSTAGEGVEVTGQGGHEGLAFAGFHLSDLTFMQHHAADQLHIKMAHAENPLAGFTHHREGFRQDLIEDRTLVRQAARVDKAFLERGRLLA